MLESFVLAVIAAWTCAPAPSRAQTPETPACAMSESDRAWIERALEAWRFASVDIAGIRALPRHRAFLFDAHCLMTSDDALASKTAEGTIWSFTPHAGSITMPDGNGIPASTTSFTSGKDGLTYFAMSTPSVWEADGIGKGPDLATTMVAVMLHEGSHVAQIGPYGKRLGALIKRYSLPDSFNDDAVQGRFGSNPEFAASVQRETATFMKAALEKDDDEAKVLAFEARELMRERAARWFVGDDAYLAEAEHIWLTFEGAGQWVAYQWITHPRGAAEAPADALPRFARDPSWVQGEGFTLVMALDRVVGPSWKSHAFGDGELSVLEMLDAALE